VTASGSTARTSVATSSAGSVTRSPVAVMTGAPTSSMLQPWSNERRAIQTTTKNSTTEDSSPPIRDTATRSRIGIVGQAEDPADRPGQHPRLGGGREAQDRRRLDLAAEPARAGQLRGEQTGQDAGRQARSERPEDRAAHPDRRRDQREQARDALQAVLGRGEHDAGDQRRAEPDRQRDRPGADAAGLLDPVGPDLGDGQPDGAPDQLEHPRDAHGGTRDPWHTPSSAEPAGA
jgi:hypothetical protein